MTHMQNSLLAKPVARVYQAAQAARGHSCGGKGAQAPASHSPRVRADKFDVQGLKHGNA
jgi:hypothetical protein